VIIRGQDLICVLVVAAASCGGMVLFWPILMALATVFTFADIGVLDAGAS